LARDPLGVLSALPVGLLIGSAAVERVASASRSRPLAFAVCMVSLVLTNPSLTDQGNG